MLILMKNIFSDAMPLLEPPVMIHQVDSEKRCKL